MRDLPLRLWTHIAQLTPASPRPWEAQLQAGDRIGGDTSPRGQQGFWARTEPSSGEGEGHSPPQPCSSNRVLLLPEPSSLPATPRALLRPRHGRTLLFPSCKDMCSHPQPFISFPPTPPSPRATCLPHLPPPRHHSRLKPFSTSREQTQPRWSSAHTFLRHLSVPTLLTSVALTWRPLFSLLALPPASTGTHQVQIGEAHVLSGESNFCVVCSSEPLWGVSDTRRLSQREHTKIPQLPHLYL